MSFHVRRFLRECEEKGVKPSEDTVTTHLRDTYGEYQRKPQGALKRVVAKVLKKSLGNSSDVTYVVQPIFTPTTASLHDDVFAHYETHHH